MISVLDTNILLRFIVGDVKYQQDQAEQYFREAENGTRHIVILPIMIAETAYVLESFYDKNRNEISDVLESFISHEWLEVRDRMVLFQTWDFYKKGFHFVDSFLLAWSKVHDGRILTFDRKLGRKKKV